MSNKSLEPTGKARRLNSALGDIMKHYSWHDVVKECERVIGCEDSAASPLMCNLPNLIRDLKWKLEQAQQITQQGDPADEGWKCGLCGKGKEVDHYGCFRSIPSR